MSIRGRSDEGRRRTGLGQASQRSRAEGVAHTARRLCSAVFYCSTHEYRSVQHSRIRTKFCRRASVATSPTICCVATRLTVAHIDLHLASALAGASPSAWSRPRAKRSSARAAHTPPWGRRSSCASPRCAAARLPTARSPGRSSGCPTRRGTAQLSPSELTPLVMTAKPKLEARLLKEAQRELRLPAKTRSKA